MRPAMDDAGFDAGLRQEVLACKNEFGVPMATKSAKTYVVRRLSLGRALTFSTEMGSQGL